MLETPSFHQGKGVQGGGTTANEGTRGSVVRMTPDVVYYSWVALDTSI